MGEEEEKRGSKGASSGWYVGSRNSWPPLLPSPEGALGNWAISEGKSFLSL